MPNDAATFGARAYRRVHGWASQIVGDATVPHEMWVISRPLWNDLSMTVACDDKRDEFLQIALSVAASQAMGIGYADHVRMQHLCNGRNVERVDDREVAHHEPHAEPVSTESARWMIERIARAAVHLEREWPDYVLVPASPTETDEGDASSPHEG